MTRFRTTSTSARVVHLVELPPRPIRRRGTVHQGPQPTGTAPEEGAPETPQLRVVQMQPVAPPAPAARRPETHGAPEGEPYRQQVGLLERRLRKLTEVLEQQEAMLARMDEAPAEETGLASVYREVQGLKEGGSGGERKREMMQKIFEANIELRKSVTG